MRRLGIAGFLGGFLLTASFAFCDSGILRFQESIPENEIVIWPSDEFIYFQARQASIRFGGEKDEEVLALQSEGVPSFSLVFSSAEPDLLFRDRNGDGKCQEGEIYRGKKGETGYGRRFEGIPVPMQVGDATRVVTLEFRHSTRAGYINDVRVTSCYRGTLSIKGNECPARLVFRNLRPAAKTVNEVIVLDTNRDGAFDFYSDDSFSASGLAFCADAFWRVKTNFSGDTAEVSLVPYDGPTGNLRVTGEGIYRVLLEARKTTIADLPEESSFLVFLRKAQNGEYVLPVGEYRVKQSILLLDQKAEVFYRYTEYGGDWFSITSPSVSVPSFPLGGPLSCQIGVDSTTLSGRADVRCDLPANSDRRTFEPVYRSLDRRRELIPPPWIEITDSRGSVVSSVQLEYG